VDYEDKDGDEDEDVCPETKQASGNEMVSGPRGR
jgi:rubredoxin